MKNPGTIVCFVCSTLLSFCIHAQSGKNKIPLNEPDYNKPKLFQSLPDTILLNSSSLDNLFTSQKGQSISSSTFTKSPLQFQGDVLSKGNSADNNVSTMVLRLSDYDGARFTLSKIINADNTERYTGRIVSFKYGDLYVLQIVNDRYALIKKNFYELVNE